MTGGSRPDDPRDYHPDELVQRFIQQRSVDSTDRTIRSYESRLERFLEWCEAEDIERVGDLTPLLVDGYGMAVRAGDAAPATVKGVLSTLRVFLGYAEELGAVDDGLSDAVPVPTLDIGQETSDVRLAPSDARAALTFFRGSTARRGTAMHAFLEVAWHVDARLGGLRGLDLDDYDADERTLEFVHRPSTGTPLKNKARGERIVGLSPTVADGVDYYLARERPDSRDDHGRSPLFATRQGRASFSTLRAHSYLSVEPCLWTECPHGRQRARCEWTEREHASKCPSSRSPHQVRTGSITWQLNRGLSIETVAARVNASPGVIRRYYDKATREEEFRERRQAIESDLDIQEDSDHE